MANIKSNKKSIIKNQKRNLMNKSRVNKVKTAKKKLEDAVKTGNKEVARIAFVEVESLLARIAQKGTLHRNTTTRITSRLSAKVKALA